MSKEIILDEYAFLVSETDEKGIITFASDHFCEIAGYHVDELIGKPHNIVRHKVWTGYVKNATKNGDFYWVFATVYPTITTEGSKGYLSCRRKATRKEIERAENLYKTLK
jgi:aerotaxis receptor